MRMKVIWANKFFDYPVIDLLNFCIKVKAKILFDVCHLFFDYFLLFSLSRGENMLQEYNFLTLHKTALVEYFFTIKMTEMYILMSQYRL